MPGERIKFRCYQCGKLLGIARHKSGSVVDCPQCRTELVVPEPAEDVPDSSADPAAEGSSPSAPERSRPEPQPEGLPFPVARDFPNFGPEDIRALPDLVFDDRPPEPPPSAPSKKETPEPPPTTPPPPAPELELEFLPLAEEPEPRSEATTPGPVPAAGAVETTEPPAPTPIVPAPEPKAADRPIGLTYSRRDVVMPRVAVIGWSLFVLLALFLSFIAGLLVGHFLWVPAPS